MSIYAKNLLTFAFDLPLTGEVLVLPHDYHRTYFAIQEIDPTNQTDARIWVGANAPVADIDDWPIIPAGGVTLEEGVAGPILVSETGSRATRIAIISALDEDSIKEFQPLSALCATNQLVTSTGDRLTADGNPLVYCV